MQTRPSDRYRSWLIGELLLVVSCSALGTVLLARHGPPRRLRAAERADRARHRRCDRRLDRRDPRRDQVPRRGAGHGSPALRRVPRDRGRDVRLRGRSGARRRRARARREAWAAIGAGLFGAALIALAPFVTRRDAAPARARCDRCARRRSRSSGSGSTRSVLGLDFDTADADGSALGCGRRRLRASRRALASSPSIGFGLRYRRHGRDLDSWLDARPHARRLRRPALRARACPLERLRPPERPAADPRLRRAARRRLAGDRRARSSAGPSPRSGRGLPARSTTASRSICSRSRRRSACSSPGPRSTRSCRV